MNQFLQNMSQQDLQIFMAVLSVVFGILFFSFWKTYRKLRIITDTPTSNIASAAQGFVELKGIGELLPGPEIHSPYSGRKCLWYECKMERKVERGDKTNWKTEERLTSEELFQLVDETGNCVIVPEGAEVHPSEKKTWYGSNAQQRHQIPVGSHLATPISDYRFSESLITVADPIYLTGHFETEQNSANPSPDDFSKAMIHTVKKPQEKNHVFMIVAGSENELVKRKHKSLLLQFIIMLLILSAIAYLYFYQPDSL